MISLQFIGFQFWNAIENALRKTKIVRTPYDIIPVFSSKLNPAIAYYFAQILIHLGAGIDHAGNDIAVACPIGAMAALATTAGQRVDVYHFDRSVPGKGEADLGAFYSIEVPYGLATQNLALFRSRLVLNEIEEPAIQE